MGHKEMLGITELRLCCSLWTSKTLMKFQWIWSKWDTKYRLGQIKFATFVQYLSVSLKQYTEYSLVTVEHCQLVDGDDIE